MNTYNGKTMEIRMVHQLLIDGQVIAWDRDYNEIKTWYDQLADRKRPLLPAVVVVAKPCPYCGMEEGHTDACIYED